MAPHIALLELAIEASETQTEAEKTETEREPRDTDTEASLASLSPLSSENVNSMP
jgi:hypothetical protein